MRKRDVARWVANHDHDQDSSAVNETKCMRDLGTLLRTDYRIPVLQIHSG